MLRSFFSRSRSGFSCHPMVTFCYRSLFIEQLEGGEKVKSPVSFTNTLKQEMKRTKGLSPIHKCISDMSKNEVTPDVQFFATAVTGLVRQREWRSALALVRRMDTDYNTTPSVYCYNPIIYHLALNREEKVIDTIFSEDFPKYNLSKDTFTLTGLVSGYAQSYNIEKTNTYISILQEGETATSPKVQQIIAAAYLQTHQFGAGFAILRKMKEQQLDVSHLYDKAISFAMKRGNTKQAELLFKEMKEETNALTVSSSTFCSLIGSYLKKKEFARVDQLVAEMREDFGISPDLALLTSLIVGNIHAEKFEEAEYLFYEVKSAGEVDGRLYDSVARAFLQSNKLWRSFDVVRESHLAGFSPTRTYYVELIQYLQRDRTLGNEKRNELIAENIAKMTKEGLRPYDIYEPRKKKDQSASMPNLEQGSSISKKNKIKEAKESSTSGNSSTITSGSSSTITS